MTLQRFRPQWARDDDEGWELYPVDRYTLRYVEGDRAVDVPVEDGIRPDDQVTTHIYVDELTWRDQGGRSGPLSDAERVGVVARVLRAVEFLGTVPIVEGRAAGA